MKERYKRFEIEVRQEWKRFSNAGESYFSVHIEGFPATLNDIQNRDFKTEGEALQAAHEFLDSI